jgi:hypothetical protein
LKLAFDICFSNQDLQFDSLHVNQHTGLGSDIHLSELIGPLSNTVSLFIVELATSQLQPSLFWHTAD